MESRKDVKNEDNGLYPQSRRPSIQRSSRLMERQPATNEVGRCNRPAHHRGDFGVERSVFPTLEGDRVKTGGLMRRFLEERSSVVSCEPRRLI
jgi:hypothetical protein